MSKLAPDAGAAPAAEPPKPAAYGASAMTDLLEEIDWAACEVLNAVSKDGVGRVMKQGLRDQAELLLESDADEQVRWPQDGATGRHTFGKVARPDPSHMVLHRDSGFSPSATFYIRVPDGGAVPWQSYWYSTVLRWLVFLCMTLNNSQEQLMPAHSIPPLPLPR